MAPKTVGIIPARMESSRFPDKAMADICGLPMIVHVYKRCQFAKTLDEVYVATDSQEIASTVEAAGGKVIMTRPDHKTGTDRIAEACQKIDCDIVVNIQGDEALVDPEHIDAVVSALHEDSSVEVAILVTPYNKYNSPSDMKTVLNENSDVMYFSRADIPSNARTENPELLKAYHIIPFKKATLLEYASWPPGYLEQIEYNEYLRLLEKGRKIRAVKVQSSAISVDHLEDLDYVIKEMKKDSLFPKYKKG